jgi:hypothetical protein
MGILKSSKELDHCIGGVFLFAGRPDPSWIVERNVVERLKKIWDSLNPISKEIPESPNLGYRGCFLKCPNDIEYFAYGGYVTQKREDRKELRRDSRRQFERLLLSSESEGLLPPSLLKDQNW